MTKEEKIEKLTQIFIEFISNTPEILEAGYEGYERAERLYKENKREISFSAYAMYFIMKAFEDLLESPS